MTIYSYYLDCCSVFRIYVINRLKLPASILQSDFFGFFIVEESFGSNDQPYVYIFLFGPSNKGDDLPLERNVDKIASNSLILSTQNATHLFYLEMVDRLISLYLNYSTLIGISISILDFAHSANERQKSGWISVSCSGC